MRRTIDLRLQLLDQFAAKQKTNIWIVLIERNNKMFSIVDNNINND
jgi:hypothetical protein